jgi:hypothetical protein
MKTPLKIKLLALLTTIALFALPITAASAQPYPPAPASQTHATPRLDTHSRDVTNAMAVSIQAQGARVARELAALETANGSAIATIPPAHIVKISPRAFPTDAMIGAGAMLGLVLLGSNLYITRRRHALPINPAH